MLIHFPGNLVAGVDEAGRGCLSGPVVAAAVILPESFAHPKLNDSKKMSEKSRNELYDYIIEHSISYGIGESSPELIDSINILNATFVAMHRALDKLNPRPEYLIIDGNRFKQYENIKHECVVKGDGKYLSIAAASVLAKVTRDRIMENLDKEFPGYGWANNKGYCVKEHIESIKKLGKNIHHRKTFHVPGLTEPIF